MHQLFTDFLVFFFFTLGNKMKGFIFPAMRKIIISPVFKGFILKTKSVLMQMETAVKSQTIISDYIKTSKK